MDLEKKAKGNGKRRQFIIQHLEVHKTFSTTLPDKVSGDLSLNAIVGLTIEKKTRMPCPKQYTHSSIQLMEFTN